MSRLAGRWWWIAVMPMALLAIASIWNTAYIFAAFIWLLMLLPTATMIVYYSYLLKPSAAAMSQPHRITIYPDRGITIKFESACDTTGLKTVPHPDIHLYGNKLNSVTEKRNHMELNYSESDIDLVIIPFDSIPAPHAVNAIAYLYNTQVKDTHYQ